MPAPHRADVRQLRCTMPMGWVPKDRLSSPAREKKRATTPSTSTSTKTKSPKRPKLADGLYPKPPGRVPKGKTWDATAGEWVQAPEDSARKPPVKAAAPNGKVKRPPGRAPKGKVWDGAEGKWVDDEQPRAETPPKPAAHQKAPKKGSTAAKSAAEGKPSPKAPAHGGTTGKGPTPSAKQTGASSADLAAANLANWRAVWGKAAIGAGACTAVGIAAIAAVTAVSRM